MKEPSNPTDTLAEVPPKFHPHAERHEVVGIDVLNTEDFYEHCDEENRCGKVTLPEMKSPQWLSHPKFTSTEPPDADTILNTVLVSSDWTLNERAQASALLSAITWWFEFWLACYRHHETAWWSKELEDRSFLDTIFQPPPLFVRKATRPFVDRAIRLLERHDDIPRHQLQSRYTRLSDAVHTLVSWLDADARGSKQHGDSWLGIETEFELFLRDLRDARQQLWPDQDAPAAELKELSDPEHRIALELHEGKKLLGREISEKLGYNDHPSNVRTVLHGMIRNGILKNHSPGYTLEVQHWRLEGDADIQPQLS